MEFIGTVSKVVTQKSDGWGIVIVTNNELFKSPVKVVGVFGHLKTGMKLHLFGNWRQHENYGPEFHIYSYVEEIPSTIDGIELYLGSGQIVGIGPKTAHKIVEYFGEATFDILNNHLERLTEIPTIGEKKAELIRNGWNENKGTRDIMMFLSSKGLTPHQVQKIYNTYGKDSIQVLREDPYRLTRDIDGIGFKTSDEIAQKIGLPLTHPSRILNGILYVIKKYSTQFGHCFVRHDTLVGDTAELLDIDASLIQDGIAEAVQKNLIVKVNAAQGESEPPLPVYYPRSLYEAERNVANDIMRVISFPAFFTLDNPQSRIHWLEQTSGNGEDFHYDEQQIKAICSAVEHKFLIITGGPGTGKSTITKSIIQLFRYQNKKVLLAAPTGRAAKRMNEICGFTDDALMSKTIHRLLEYKVDSGFTRNSDRPLEGDVLIVDECSMIDIQLMECLLAAIPSGMRIIMIGDVDQLPSVGPGNVLNDIIQSNIVPTIRLNKVFRQASDSKIIRTAHRINHGQMPDSTCNPDDDCYILSVKDEQDCMTQLMDLYFHRLPDRYNIDPVRDIQILTPMRKRGCGVNEINKQIQTTLATKDDMWLHNAENNIALRIGDKVMQIKNNYNKNVYNGDIGEVEFIDIENSFVHISYNDADSPVVYTNRELDEIVLAYACTIHKSQGSEYPVVIIPVLRSQGIMLHRKLIYTAVTRSKRLLIILCEPTALNIAVANNRSSQRNTMLASILRRGRKQWR